MKMLQSQLQLFLVKRRMLSRAVQLFVIGLAIFVSGTGQAHPPQRSYEQAWASIMADLEAVIRSQVVHGPYIDQTPEEFGMGEGDHIFEAIQSARQYPEYRNSRELQHYEDQRKVIGWQANLLDLYIYRNEQDRKQRKILQKDLSQTLMDLFHRSFQRELGRLSSAEAGKLMAHFASQVPLRGPLFMSPLVYFAWSSQREVQQEIQRMAQEMIWETGNREGILAFVPHLLTNRTGTYADFDETRTYIDSNHQTLPSSHLESWFERYPQETKQAFQDFEWAAVWGDLRKPSFFNLPEFVGFWSATPVQEIQSMLEYKKKKGQFASKPSAVSCIRAHRL